MSDAKSAWEEVGSTFSGLGMKLKLHFEQARADEGVAAPPDPTQGDGTNGATTVPGSTEPTAAAGSGAEGAAGKQEEVKEALRKLGAAIDDAFGALGAAVKDPAVKDDVRHVGQSLSGALSATFADVSDDLKRAFRRHKDDTPGAPADEAAAPTDDAKGEPGP